MATETSTMCSRDLEYAYVCVALSRTASPILPRSLLQAFARAATGCCCTKTLKSNTTSRPYKLVRVVNPVGVLSGVNLCTGAINTSAKVANHARVVIPLTVLFCLPLSFSPQRAFSDHVAVDPRDLKSCYSLMISSGE